MRKHFYTKLGMLSQFSANQKGMMLALGGYTAFAWSDTAVKWIAPHYPVFQVMAVQTGFASMIFLFLARFLGGWSGWNNNRELKFHLVRAVFNVLVSMLVFYSFTIMSLASVYSMIFAKPIFAAILAIIFYKEIVTGSRWAAIAVGFAGVLIILQPSPETFRADLLIPLLAAFLVAIMFILSRSLTNASPFIMSFYPVAGTYLIVMPFALYFGTPDISLLLTEGRLAFIPSKPIALEHLPYFIMAAAFSGTGILCVSLAFRVGEAAIVAPFLYTEMIWGILFGLLIFGDVPRPLMLVGTTIVVASGLYLILVERWRRPALAAAPSIAVPIPRRKSNPRRWNIFHEQPAPKPDTLDHQE
jgi:drug/metabolite transporter (DMT)-like permease